MNAFSVAGFLTCVSALVLGIFVYSREKGRRVNQLWLAFSVAVVVWGGGSVWISLENDPQQALLAWRLSFAFGVVWIPILFLHFVLVFGQLTRRGLLPLSYAIGGGMALMALSSPHFFQDVRLMFSSMYFPVPGSFFLPGFLVPWVTGVIYNHILLIQAFSESDPLKREQIRYFFLATAIGFTGGSLTYLPIFGMDIYPWGHFAIPLYPVIMAYAIAKYRLMDMTLMMEKGLSVLTVFLLAAFPVGGVLLWGQHQYLGGINLTFSVLLLVMMASIGIGSYALRIHAERAIGRALFKQRHEMYDTMSNFAQALISILDFHTLTATIVRTSVQEMGIAHATLYLWEKEKNMFLPVASAGTTPPVYVPHFMEGDPLPLRLRAQPSVVLREELEQQDIENRTSEIVSLLLRMQVAVCMPFINTKQQLIGFCLLGPRKEPSRGYAGEDLQLLGFLSRNAATALDNALMYQDLQRSQALLRRTERLHHLELMAGGFAHEVRNPLTSIKIFIEMAPEKREDRRFMQEFGKVVTEDVSRIERLTQEVLDFSHQANPQFQAENLNAIVDTCVSTLLLEAQDGRIEVEKDLAPVLPSLSLDRPQFKQVLLNLLYNGWEAMGESGGILTVRTSLVFTADLRESGVRLDVVDQGVGIPPETLPHIFDPFFTTKHKRKGRHGTGLGLPITKQIIQTHGGSLEVASEVGKGTTFSVILPIALPHVVPLADPDMLASHS